MSRRDLGYVSGYTSVKAYVEGLPVAVATQSGGTETTYTGYKVFLLQVQEASR